MNYKWSHSAILFIAAIGFFLLSEYSTSIISALYNSEPKFKRIERKIQKDLNEAERYAQFFIDKSSRYGISKVFKIYTDSLSDELAKKNISILLFRNDKLVFWSNSLDFKTATTNKSKYFLCNIQNTWYVGQWVAVKSDKVLALLLLKHEYPYQNKFLENSYNPKFNDLKGYLIADRNDTNTKSLTLKDGTTINLRKSKSLNNEWYNILKSILQWISFILLLGAVFTFFNLQYFKRKPLLFSLISSGIIILLRLLSLEFGYPNRGLGALFSPEVYAHTTFNPSLGDFLINAILFFVLVIFIYRKFRLSIISESIKYKKIYVIILSALVWSVYILVDTLFSSLIMHSTITLETYRIFNLSIFSLLCYVAISFWIVSSLLLTDLWTSIFRKCFDESTLALNALFGFIIAYAIAIVLGFMPTLYGLLWSIATFGLLFRLRYRNLQISTSWFLVLLCFLALYSVLLVSDFTFRKDREVRKVLAINLSNERDPVAETLFGSLTRRLEADSIIHQYLENIQKHDIEMYGYLQNSYFNGYFKKYNFRATVCYPGSDLIMDNSDQKVDCNGFFNDLINVYGIGIPGTSFYFLNTQNGRINYVGYAECKHKSRTSRLYIEFDSKMNLEQLGYPELLLEEKFISKSKLSVYSTAKYHQNQLIAQTGDYPYRLESIFKLDSTQKFDFTNQGKYNHLVYRNDDDDIVIISRPRETLLNTTASFAYIFFFFGLMLILWFKLAMFPIRTRSEISSFKYRIKTAMILVVFLSLILVATVSVIYSIKSFEKRSIDNLSEKLLSVMVEIERDYGKEDLFTSSNYDFLSNKLFQLSNVFYSDINLYSTSGILVGSSRPEIFERQLQGRNMNPAAWYEMAYCNTQKIIHKEQIGNMSFLSAYVPLIDQNSNIIGYLNLPYFTRQGEFILELYSIIVAIINIYALITLFAFVVAIIISNQISKPLELIREKIRNVDISGHNEPIKYVSDDELGQLVKEYNRMVLELADSAEKLARSQRESAWREMARQIAHEIKNPLTPMKLSLQHLIKVKQEGREDWDLMFQKFSVSLIDQINSLSNIATEFSNFAKMPVSSIVEVNMNLIIDEILTLFSGYNNIKFTYVNGCGSQITVNGDREQLFRVFVNLIKNAVQSIDRGKKGEIRIELSCKERKMTAIIEDNGKGIPDDLRPKLFSPNFTTKSGGMGLGLAIVKGIVESTGGKIWFETELGKGTKFFVELPLS
ncbi:MAG: GHKL domain-containing protein [Bacteroidales bacterium]|nr:GHKL domain-containing protein [Bacteroidales bacterium]